MGERVGPVVTARLGEGPLAELVGLGDGRRPEGPRIRRLSGLLQQQGGSEGAPLRRRQT
jgi:hypothetical protein